MNNIAIPMTEVIRAFHSEFNFSFAGLKECLIMALWVDVRDRTVPRGWDTHRIVHICVINEPIEFQGQKGKLQTVLWSANKDSRTHLDIASWEIIHNASGLRPSYEMSIEQKIDQLVGQLIADFKTELPDADPQVMIKFFVHGCPHVVALDEFVPADDRKTARLLFRTPPAARRLS